MTDFHSHILPGIDDGSASPQESVAMLRMEKEQGIQRVAATPHFDARLDDPDLFLAKRKKAEADLQLALAGEMGIPDVIAGAEVSFFRGMSHSEFLPQLAIGDSRCILIEMPLAPWPEEYYRELAQIWELRRLMPVVAHIDRYIGPLRTFGIPDRLADMQVAVQANGDFFLEKRTAAMAMKMLKNNRIQVLGSDCHNMSSRKPNLGDALERIRDRLGEKAVQRIRDYERLILSL